MLEQLKYLLQVVLGIGSGADVDGLKKMISDRIETNWYENSAAPSEQTIMSHARGLLDAMGVNPFTSLAQGLALNMAQLYPVMPSLGELMGLPNPKTFFSQVANGSNAIASAAGLGIGDIFNPYSVREAHDLAVSLSKQVYDITSRGGLNIGFTHGLNMDDLGGMTQRLLASRFVYDKYDYDTVSGDGDKRKNIIKSLQSKGVLDVTIDDDAEELRKNLEAFGDKINAAASSINKVTGSFNRTIQLLDSLAGGNFLSGNAERAMNTITRAQNMAAAIRVTSAMAGVDPTETFAEISGLSENMVSKLGVDKGTAYLSGLAWRSGIEPAYNTVMAYNTWAAANPDATVLQKAQALEGLKARTLAFTGSTAEDLAAVIAYHKDRFSEEQISKFENDFRSGRASDALGEVYRTLGYNTTATMLSDKALLANARLQGDRETMSKLYSAGMEGVVYEAATEGTRRNYNMLMSSADEQLHSLGVEVNPIRYREEAAKEGLRDMALKYMSQDLFESSSYGEIRNFLGRWGVDQEEIDTQSYAAAIDAQINLIKKHTIEAGSSEEEAVRNNIIASIESSSASDEAKLELVNQVRNSNELGGTVLDVAKKLTFNETERQNFIRRVTGGKFLHDTAQKQIDILEEAKGDIAPNEADMEENLRHAENVINKQKKLAHSGDLTAILNGDEFGRQSTDKDRLEYFVKQVELLDKEGGFRWLPKGSDAGKFVDNAIKDVLIKDFGTKIGKLGEKDLKYGSLVDSMATSIKKDVRNGMSFSDAFVDAFNNLTPEQLGYDESNKEEAAEFEKLKQEMGDRARDGNGITAQRVLSAMISVINKNAPQQALTEEERDTARRMAILYPKLKNIGLSQSSAQAVALATVAAYGEKQGATLTMTDDMLRQISAGVKPNEIGLIKSNWAELIQVLDDDASAAKQKRVQNAIVLKDGSIGNKVVQENFELLDKLAKSFENNNIGVEDVKGALSTDDPNDKKLQKLRTEVGKVVGTDKNEQNKAIEFLRSLKNSEFEVFDASGNKSRLSGIDLLGKDQSERSDISKTESGRKAMGDVIMQTEYATNTTAYDILNGISNIIELLRKVTTFPIPIKLGF